MKICRAIASIFGVVYLIALVLFVIGAYGLLGQERDPLSAVFLVPVGLPWNLLLGDVPEPLQPWLAAAAPAVNVAILWLVCRALGSRRV